eukprot:CAMPEP_0119269046 /NCGR_PEP_ID=MMETSP1329-20130426/6606_1 /TAXON_ID=114041 /ORGANISM="Genus nov. species nov., Strain RCC1024" /LENGTH=202 /DNA_ID=CAMNT_0007269033 /DNA_START=36 /DNA_END=641 /DNA_ORIENTATION=+
MLLKHAHSAVRAAAARSAASSRRATRSSSARFATKAAINLNADLGEGYGPWSLTDDAALMDVVTTANVACGGHAGDAAIMGACLELAAKKGVSVGAHPGFEDKPGFGRRPLPLTTSEIEDLVAAQTGALLGCAKLARLRHGGAGAEVTHVKPHGALNNVACVDAAVAEAIARAVKALDPSLIMLAPAASELLAAAEAAGLPT